MSKPPLIALGTDNPHVLETIKSAVESYFLSNGARQELTIPTLPADWEEPAEEIEPLIKRALEKASLARTKYEATIGVAGAWGYVTLRENARSALRFPTFFAVAASTEGFLNVSFPSVTCPDNHANTLLTLVQRVMETKLRTDPTDELYVLAGIATGSWVGLRFPHEPAIHVALH
jgi:hypothetical protein